jgi:hypothetical protein
MGNRCIHIEREWEFLSPSQLDPKKRCWKLWHSVCYKCDFFIDVMHYYPCLEMEEAKVTYNIHYTTRYFPLQTEMTKSYPSFKSRHNLQHDFIVLTRINQ